MGATGLEHRATGQLVRVRFLYPPLTGPRIRWRGFGGPPARFRQEDSGGGPSPPPTALFRAAEPRTGQDKTSVVSDR